MRFRPLLVAAVVAVPAVSFAQNSNLTHNGSIGPAA